MLKRILAVVAFFATVGLTFGQGLGASSGLDRAARNKFTHMYVDTFYSYTENAVAFEDTIKGDIAIVTPILQVKNIYEDSTGQGITVHDSTTFLNDVVFSQSASDFFIVTSDGDTVKLDPRKGYRMLFTKVGTDTMFAADSLGNGGFIGKLGVGVLIPTAQLEVITSGSAVGILLDGNKTTGNLLQLVNDNSGTAGDSTFIVTKLGTVDINVTGAANALDIDGNKTSGYLIQAVNDDDGAVLGDSMFTVASTGAVKVKVKGSAIGLSVDGGKTSSNIAEFVNDDDGVATGDSSTYITTIGNIVTQDIAVNGSDITSTADIDIEPAGGDVNIDAYIMNDQTVNQTTKQSLSAIQRASTLQDGSAYTGTDVTMSTQWIATKFTASGNHTVGNIRIRIKESSDITNTTAYLTGYIYADDGGSPSKPSTLVSGATLDNILFGTLTTSYQVLSAGSPASAVTLTSGTAYWLVLKYSAATTPATAIRLDSDASANMGATSADGLAWTNTTERLYFQIMGLTGTGVYAYSSNDTALVGKSVDGYGIYGLSTNNNGGYFTSTNNAALYGASNYGSGVIGTSVGSYGVYAATSSSYALYATATSGVGLYASVNPSSTNSTASVVELYRNTSGTAANNIGLSINAYLEDAAGQTELTGRIANVMTNATSGAETSKLGFWTRTGGAAIAENALLYGNGDFHVTGDFRPAVNGGSDLGQTSFKFDSLYVATVTNGAAGMTIGTSGDYDVTVNADTTKMKYATFGAVSSGTSKGVATVTVNSLGETAPTNAQTLALVNNTAAVVGGSGDQFSPGIRLRGYAWETTGGTSQPVEWKIYSVPSTGTAASSSIYFDHSINGAAYANKAYLASDGTLTLAGGLGIGAGKALYCNSGEYPQIFYYANSSPFITANFSGAGAIDEASGSETFFKIYPVINQSGTAGWTVLEVDASITADAGSGSKYLQEWKYGGTQKAYLNSAGQFQTDGAVSIGTLAPGTAMLQVYNGSYSMASSGIGLDADAQSGIYASADNVVSISANNALEASFAATGFSMPTGNSVTLGTVQWDESATDSIDGSAISANDIPVNRIAQLSPSLNVVTDANGHITTSGALAVLVGDSLEGDLVKANDLPVNRIEQLTASKYIQTDANGHLTTLDSLNGAIIAARTIPAKSIALSYIDSNVRCAEVWVTSASQNPALVTLPANSKVLSVDCWVSEAFTSDGTDEVTVGYDGAVTEYATAIDVSSTGIKTVTLGATAKTVDATSRAVEVYYTNGGSEPGAGKAHISITYQQCTVSP